MVVVWLLEAAVSVVTWLVGALPELPALTLPAPLDVVVPVPFMDAGSIGGLNSWAASGLILAAALTVGSVLQWVYGLIPLKAT